MSFHVWFPFPSVLKVLIEGVCDCFEGKKRESGSEVQLLDYCSSSILVLDWRGKIL